MDSRLRSCSSINITGLVYPICESNFCKEKIDHEICPLLFFAVCLLLPSTGFATTVNVAVPSFSMSLAAESLPQERSYYRQQGLDVNFVLMPTAIATGLNRWQTNRLRPIAEKRPVL